MAEQLTSHIFTFPVPLPDNPLKSINCYVIKTPERSLIIDTGFRHPDCLAALGAGIGEIGLDRRKTDLFITHVHSDHAGLMADIAGPHTQVYMHATDLALLGHLLEGAVAFRSSTVAAYMKEGYPEDRVMIALQTNPAFVYAPNRAVPVTPVKDGDIIRVGNIELQCVHTPGHTPGHTCLYWPGEEILFAGDHILYTITPNITTWPDVTDSLGDYLGSLEKIRGYPVRRGFAAHRACEGDVHSRAGQLIAHHQERLAAVMDIVRENPHICGYDVASKMKWSIRARDWDDFPETQKWFAVGEALAHLDHLRLTGQIERHDNGERHGYTISR